MYCQYCGTVLVLVRMRLCVSKSKVPTHTHTSRRCGDDATTQTRYRGNVRRGSWFVFVLIDVVGRCIELLSCEFS